MKEIMLSNFFITADNNHISDISVVPKLNFPKLREFDLEGNRIKDEEFLCFVTKNSMSQRAKNKYSFIQLWYLPFSFLFLIASYEM